MESKHHLEQDGNRWACGPPPRRLLKCANTGKHHTTAWAPVGAPGLFTPDLSPGFAGAKLKRQSVRRRNASNWRQAVNRAASACSIYFFSIEGHVSNVSKIQQVRGLTDSDLQLMSKSSRFRSNPGLSVVLLGILEVCLNSSMRRFDWSSPST